jgi:uncharacterized membrane protein YgdD (TMEM256/DUF423 family)
MTSLGRTLLILAALSGLVSVGAGASAAHGVADPQAGEWLHIGSSYEMTHALAVFAAVFVAQSGSRRAVAAAILFLAGSVLFSGSLYALALGAPHIVGSAVPIGGVAFMAGWIVLAWACAGLKKAA